MSRGAGSRALKRGYGCRWPVAVPSEKPVDTAYLAGDVAQEAPLSSRDGGVLLLDQRCNQGLGLLIGAKSASHMFEAPRRPFVISRDTGLVIFVWAASKGEAQGWG